MSEYVAPKYRIMKDRDNKFVVQKQKITCSTRMIRKPWYLRAANLISGEPNYIAVETQIEEWVAAGKTCVGNLMHIVYMPFVTKEEARSWIEEELRIHKSSWERKQLPELRFVEDYP